MKVRQIIRYVMLLLLAAAFAVSLATSWASADDRDWRTETISKNNSTTQVVLNSLTHSVSSVKTLQGFDEISKEMPDGRGFRAVVISQHRAKDSLRLEYVRLGEHGDYELKSAQLSFRSHRQMHSNRDTCDALALPAQLKTVMAVADTRFIPSVGSSCGDQKNRIAQIAGDFATNQAKSIGSCVEGQFNGSSPQEEWQLKLSAHTHQIIFSCDRNKSPENVQDKVVELGDVSTYAGNPSLLAETMIHEMVHTKSISEEATEGIAACCANYEFGSPSCQRSGNLPLAFKIDKFPTYGMALDSISRGKSPAEKKEIIDELKNQFALVRGGLAVTPPKYINSAAFITALNQSVLKICHEHSSASTCDGIASDLRKDLGRESALCAPLNATTCLSKYLRTTNDDAGVAITASPGIVAQTTGATNSKPGVDLNSNADSPATQTVIAYQPIAGDNSAAMNRFIATSATSSVAIQRIATNALAPIGGLIESTAQASETASGTGAADYSMAVSQSDNNGTTFVTSSGTTVVTKQKFANLPNALVNAGLDMPSGNDSARALASTTKAGAGGGAISSGSGAPALGSNGGISSGGSGQGATTNTSTSARGQTNAKLPQPTQVQSKRDAFIWLAKVPEPATLLCQKWFNQKLIEYKARVSYRNQSYGDPNTKSILTVESLRGQQP